MESGSNREAARLHYVYCKGCGEYKSHSVTPPVCAGNCGLVMHNDPKCPLRGKVIGNYDC